MPAPRRRGRRRPRPPISTRRASTPRPRKRPRKASRSWGSSRNDGRAGRPAPLGRRRLASARGQGGQVLAAGAVGFLGRLVGHPLAGPAAHDHLVALTIPDVPAPEARLGHQLHLDAEMLRASPLHAATLLLWSGRKLQGRCLHTAAPGCAQRAVISVERVAACGPDGRPVPEFSLKGREAISMGSRGGSVAGRRRGRRRGARARLGPSALPTLSALWADHLARVRRLEALPALRPSIPQGFTSAMSYL